MAVQLTPQAASYIQGCLAKKPDAIGFQVGITKTGCSGLSYKYDYVTQPLLGAECFESQGIMVWVKKDHLYALEGVELDCVKEGLNYLLVPKKNPNAQNACGCGESFYVANHADPKDP